MLPVEPETAFYDSLHEYQDYINAELAKQKLPAASTDAIAVSYQLALNIINRVNALGAMPFGDFMNAALYESGLGYYASGNQKFGEGGDFVTAPEISPLFSQAIANQIAEIFNVAEANILELGAGSGVFAADCILELEAQNKLPEKYFILEVSAELQARQKQTLADKVPHLLERFEWLTQVPQNHNGVVFANEVVDAIPVGLLRKTLHGMESAEVSFDEDGFRLQWRNTDKRIEAELERGQIVEDRSNIAIWLSSLIDSLDKAVVLLVDYGDSEVNIYSSARQAGTLQQYYRHHKTSNPLALIGMQDITASVDFSQLAKVADDNHCQLLGYTTQNMFLMANGIESLAQLKVESQDASDTMAPMKIGQQLKQLMMPDEMGETCKVLAFAKNVELDLQGFSLDNRLHKL